MSEIRDFIVHRSEFNQAERWFHRSFNTNWQTSAGIRNLSTELNLTFSPEEGDLVPEDMGRVHLVLTVNITKWAGTEYAETTSIVETFPVYSYEGKSLESTINDARWEATSFLHGIVTALNLPTNP